jgi:hypothetical protein
MNDAILIQLQIIVERTVRPVLASTPRKRKMREELLAHVSGVFAEESARIGDERAALERTALRFGNPAEVTSQLQESVPASDGINRFFDLDSLHKESTLRHAVPLARVTGAVVLIIAIFGTALVAGWWSASLNEALICGAMFAVVSPAYAFGLGLLTNRVERMVRRGRTEINPADYHVSACGWLAETAEALKGPSGRSWLPVVLVADFCLLILFCIAATIWPLEDWPGLALALLAGYAVLGSVVCAWAFANSAAVRQRYHEAWARLPIEPTL